MNKALALLLGAFAVAAIIMGLALGLTKGYVPGESKDDSAIIDCGRPFKANEADLTNFGLAGCEAEGGLADRRAYGFGFIGAGVAFGMFATIAARTNAAAAAPSTTFIPGGAGGPSPA
jgi:hypothetical protein